MKIHQGDLVLIISGKDKGKQGTVLRVLASKNHLVVEGINMRTRHIKKTTQAAGQRIQYEASLDASKVMIIDPKTKKPTRIGYKIDEKGMKKRIAKASGDVIVKAAKTAAKSKTSAKKEETKVEKKQEVAKLPEAKKAFWKRSATAKGGDDVKEGGKDGGAAALPMAHRSQGG